MDKCLSIYLYAKSLQFCLTLCDPVGCSLSGSSVHGILQARILKWVAMPCSKGIFLTQGSNLGLLLSCTDRQVLCHQCQLGICLAKKFVQVFLTILWKNPSELLDQSHIYRYRYANAHVLTLEPKSLDLDDRPFVKVKVLFFLHLMDRGMDVILIPCQLFFSLQVRALHLLPEALTFFNLRCSCSSFPIFLLLVKKP